MKFKIGDDVIFNNEILKIKSFGYFWEGVCELSDGTCTKLKYLVKVSDIEKYSREKQLEVVSKIFYKNFIRYLVS